MKLARVLITAASLLMAAVAAQAQEENCQYKLMATNKTSTMQKEMNEAAAAGFRFVGVMGGETSFGGQEVVVIAERCPGADQKDRYQYKLQATQKTGTMQKELQQAGDAGFGFVGVTVASTTLGGSELVVITRRPRGTQ